MEMNLTNNIPDETEQNSIVDFYRILFKRKNAIAIFFVVVMTLTVIITFSSTEIYQSNSSILVKLGRENVSLDPTVMDGEVNTVRQDLSNVINSEIQILKSRDLVEMTVGSLGVEMFEEKNEHGLKARIAKIKSKIKNFVTFSNDTETDPVIGDQNKEAIIDRVKNSFTSVAISDSNIITLSYEDKKPELAQTVLQTLLNNYLNKHITVHSTNGSYEFFNEQVEKLHEDIQNTGKRLNDIKNETGIASMEKQRTLMLERVDGLKRNLADVESSLAASRKKFDMLTKTMNEIPKTMVQTQTTGSITSAVEELRKQIYLLKLEEQELLSKYSNESVPIKEIRRQIKSAQSLLEEAKSPEAITSGVNITYQQVEMNMMLEKANVTALEAKYREITSQIEKAENEIKVLNNNEIEINSIERDLELDEANYRKYTEGKEQARIDSALELGKLSNISITQPATRPVDPIRPNKKMNLICGFLFALFGAIGLAFFIDFMDHSFSTPEEVEKKTGLPTLGSLPVMGTNRSAQIEIDREEQLYLMNEKMTMIPYDDESDGALELIGQNTEGELSKEKHNGKIFSITSSRQGEGVSTFAIYFSTMLSNNLDKRVLLIDINFEKPSIHKLLNGKISPGLLDYLFKKKATDIIQHTTTHGFDFITIGKDALYRLYVPQKALVAKFLQSMRSRYDYVILDTPPIWNGTGPKATNIGNLADAVVLVVEAEKLRWEVALRSKKRLEKMHANILGIVLNKRRYHIPNWLYKHL